MTVCNQGTTVKVKLSKPDYRDHQFADIDLCIAPIVAALNRSGIHTEASCCGHGKIPGRISLRDGRELIIAQNYQEAHRFLRIMKRLRKSCGLPVSYPFG